MSKERTKKVLDRGINNATSKVLITEEVLITVEAVSVLFNNPDLKELVKEEISQNDRFFEGIKKGMEKAGLDSRYIEAVDVLSSTPDFMEFIEIDTDSIEVACLDGPYLLYRATCILKHEMLVGELSFENANQMYDYILNEGDIYSEEEGLYVFNDNEDGAICVYEGIPKDSAKELSADMRETDEVGWSAFIVCGRNAIYGCDEPFDGAGKCEVLSWCDAHYNAHTWVRADKYTFWRDAA